MDAFEDEPGDLAFPDDPDERTESAWLGSVAAVAGAASIAALALPWVSGRLPGRDYTARGYQIAYGWWLMLALGVALLVVGALIRAGRREVSPSLAPVIAGALVGIALFVLVATEVISSLLPRKLLPSGVRNLAFGAEAGTGPWLMVCAGGAVLLLWVLDRQLSEDAVLRLRTNLMANPAATAARVVCAGCLFALIQIRATTWVAIRGEFQGIHVSNATLQRLLDANSSIDSGASGADVPWLGITVFVLLLATALIVLVVWFRPTHGGVVLQGALAGTLMAVGMGATTITGAAGGLAEWMVERLLDDRAEVNAEVTGAIGRFTLVAFVLLVASVVLLYVVRLDDDQERLRATDRLRARWAQFRSTAASAAASATDGFLP